MKVLRSLFLFFFLIMLVSACKKDEKGPDLNSPVGFYKGTVTYSANAGSSSIAFLLRSDFSGTEYLAAVGVTDTAAMNKQVMKWAYNGTDLTIERPNLSGYNYRATVAVPISAITGKSGIYSLGSYQPNGTFTVTRN